MKTILISILLLITATTKAQGIRFDPNNQPPIFGSLNLSGVTRNMTLINAGFRLVISGHVMFNNKSLELTLNRKMPPCAPNMMCIQVMPAPLFVKLSVVKVINTGCSTKYIATTPANVRAAIYEQVVVEDFSFSTCLAANNVSSVSYKATGISSLSKQQETATAHFLVDGDFVHAVN